MKIKCGFAVPTNVRVFKSHYDYYHGIGQLTQKECVDRSLLVSGVTIIDQNEYDDYKKIHHLDTILD
jgi:hypothetical protein